MLIFAVAPGVNVNAISRGVVGPTTWPKAMLLGIIACAVVLLVRHILAERLSSQRPKTTALASHDVMSEEYDNRKAALGILVMLGYGAGIPIFGFGPTTVLCILCVLLLGGLRKPVTIGLVSILGTVAVLYLFVKVTAMPLDRGMGFFNDLNLLIYRVLGIF